MIDQLREAIRNKRQIITTYQGRRRELCPHGLGQDDDGEWKLVAYQFGGQSSKPLSIDGSADNWRCLFVGKMIGLEVVEGEWHTADVWTFSLNPDDGRGKGCYTFLDTAVSV